MPAISWKRAGNSALRAARAIVMLPVSSGSRSASNARGALELGKFVVKEQHAVVRQRDLPPVSSFKVRPDFHQINGQTLTMARASR